MPARSQHAVRLLVGVLAVFYAAGWTIAAAVFWWQLTSDGNDVAAGKLVIASSATLPLIGGAGTYLIRCGLRKQR